MKPSFHSGSRSMVNEFLVTNARVCELDRLIEQAIATVHSSGRRKDILFARTTGHDGLRVFVDPTRAEGMIVAVLANAIDRSPRRGIVTIDIRPYDEQVGLAISDQGWGPDRASGRIARPSGENLLLAFDRTGEMDGNITYRPTEDEGSTVVLGFKRA